MSQKLNETAGIEDLLARARAGDPEAENALFTRIQARVLALAKRRVWNAEAAEDIAQETLRTALEKYRQSEMPRGFLPWLFTILHHKVGNYLKSRRAEIGRLGTDAAKSESDWDTVGVSPEAEIAALELARALETALRQVSLECREIFRLLLEGAGRKEICDAFGGEPIGTVDSRISRCRAKLLVHLESSGKKARRR